MGGLVFLLPVFLLAVEHTLIDSCRTFLLFVSLGSTLKAESGRSISGSAAVETHSLTLTMPAKTYGFMISHNAAHVALATVVNATQQEAIRPQLEG